MDMNRPFYIPEATLKRYNDLVHRHKEAVSVQQFNAREAILAVQERNARPWWKRIFGGDRSSSDKRGPLDPRLMVAAALVLLVIVVVVVVALVKRKNGGHQKFSSQPTQGLWGASGGCPR
jgi:type II secretory pathway component PulK